MRYRRLGKSGLLVSEIGLGTTVFGTLVDDQPSVSMIERALGLGINFIDTADVYPAGRRGRCEQLVGKAVSGRRADWIISTKFGSSKSEYPGGSRTNVMKAAEASLRRLDTDYIDLYYVHSPDSQTPIEETLRAMDDLVRSGKVRFIGCSNFAAWQLGEATEISKSHNLVSFAALESRYNLLDREIEQELVTYCQAHGIGVIPWGPLASGLLTGKYGPGQESREGGRLLSYVPAAYRDLVAEANFDKIAELEVFASERGHTLGDLAIAWLLSHPWLSSVIAGATKEEQVSANVASADWKMSTEDVALLDGIL